MYYYIYIYKCVCIYIYIYKMFVSVLLLLLLKQLTFPELKPQHFSHFINIKRTIKM